MKTILITCSLFFYTAIFAQGGKKYIFPKIGWTINLPDDFLVTDSAGGQMFLNEGVDLVEKKANIKVDTTETVVLIVANKNTNYFSAYITIYNPTTDGDWIEGHERMKILTYNSFKSILPKAILDTISTKETLDGIPFEKFIITVSVDGTVSLVTVALSSFYKGYDFGITYSYNDETMKAQMEKMLTASKFKK